MIKEIVEANLAQANGLPYPTMIELNSDQIWECNLLEPKHSGENR